MFRSIIILATQVSSMAASRCCILASLIFVVTAYPEESIFDTTVTDESTFQISKCMKPGGSVYVKVYCETNVDVKIDWVIASSTCVQAFTQFNAVRGKINKTFYVTVLRAPYKDKETYLTKTRTMSCTSFSPITGRLSSTWSTGVYLVSMQVSCSSKTCSPPIRITVKIKNKNGGYLSPIDFPYLPFSGTLIGVYFLLGIVWLTFAARFWNHLTMIQVYTGVLLLFGLWEHATWTAVYATIEKSGTASSAGVYVAELVSCFRRTFGRVLLLIVCLGYGINQYSLGRLWFRRCLQLGLVYFILLSTEAVIRTREPRFRNSYAILLVIIPLAVMDALFSCWIMDYLSRSLRATRERYHVFKYRLYLNFSRLLILFFLVSFAFAIFSTVYLEFGNCIEHWQYLWLDDAYWQVLFVVFVVTVMVLWRPSDLNRFYAYSLLDQTDSDSEDPAVMDVLFDRSELLHPDNVVRSRTVETAAEAIEMDVLPKTGDQATAKMSGKYSIQSPPSPSIMERIVSVKDEPTPEWKTA